MHILDLPPEKIEEIFYFLSPIDPPDTSLKTVSLVCRSWRELTLRRLFRSIQYSFFLDDNPINNQVYVKHRHCQSHRHIRDFLAFLEQNPTAAASIQQLCIHNASHGYVSLEEMNDVKPDYIYAVLKLLPGLRKLFLVNISFSSTPDVTQLIHLEKLVLDYSTTHFIFTLTQVGAVLCMFGKLDLLLVSNVQLRVASPPSLALTYLRHLQPCVVRWECKNISQKRFTATFYTFLAALHASGNVARLRDLEVEVYSDIGYIDDLLAMVRMFVPHVEWLKCRINHIRYLESGYRMRGHSDEDEDSKDREEDEDSKDNEKDKDYEKDRPEERDDVFQPELTLETRTPLSKLRVVTLNFIGYCSEETDIHRTQLRTGAYLLRSITPDPATEREKRLSQTKSQTQDPIDTEFMAVELRLPRNLEIACSSDDSKPTMGWTEIEDALLGLLSNANAEDSALTPGSFKTRDVYPSTRAKFVLIMATDQAIRGYSFASETKSNIQNLGLRRLHECNMLRDGSHSWKYWEAEFSSHPTEAYRGTWFKK